MKVSLYSCYYIQPPLVFEILQLVPDQSVSKKIQNMMVKKLQIGSKTPTCQAEAEAHSPGLRDLAASGH